MLLYQTNGCSTTLTCGVRWLCTDDEAKGEPTRPRKQYRRTGTKLEQQHEAEARLRELKHKRGHLLEASAKAIVAHVHETLFVENRIWQQKNPKKRLPGHRDLDERTAKLCGVSRHIVVEIMKESRDANKFTARVRGKSQQHRRKKQSKRKYFP